MTNEQFINEKFAEQIKKLKTEEVHIGGKWTYLPLTIIPIKTCVARCFMTHGKVEVESLLNQEKFDDKKCVCRYGFDYSNVNQNRYHPCKVCMNETNGLPMWLKSRYYPKPNELTQEEKELICELPTVKERFDGYLERSSNGNLSVNVNGSKQELLNTKNKLTFIREQDKQHYYIVDLKKLI